MQTNADIPWFAPVMTGAEMGGSLSVLNRNFLDDGPSTREFGGRNRNRAVCHAVAVAGGTAAIALALMAKGVGPCDEVIIPTLPSWRRECGRPCPARRSSSRTWSWTALRCRRNRSPNDRADGAVVQDDVNGRGADYRWLEPFCRQHGLALICGAAEASVGSTAVLGFIWGRSLFLRFHQQDRNHRPGRHDRHPA